LIAAALAQDPRCGLPVVVAGAPSLPLLALGAAISGRQCLSLHAQHEGLQVSMRSPALCEHAGAVLDRRAAPL